MGYKARQGILYPLKQRRRVPSRIIYSKCIEGVLICSVIFRAQGVPGRPHFERTRSRSTGLGQIHHIFVIQMSWQNTPALRGWQIVMKKIILDNLFLLFAIFTYKYICRLPVVGGCKFYIHVQLQFHPHTQRQHRHASHLKQEM